MESVNQNVVNVNPRDVEVRSVRELIEFGAEHTSYNSEEISYLLRQVYLSMPKHVRWQALWGVTTNFDEYPASIYIALINALVVIDNHRSVEVPPPPDDGEKLSPQLSNLLTGFKAALDRRQVAA